MEVCVAVGAPGAELQVSPMAGRGWYLCSSEGGSHPGMEITLKTPEFDAKLCGNVCWFVKDLEFISVL